MEIIVRTIICHLSSAEVRINCSIKEPTEAARGREEVSPVAGGSAQVVWIVNTVIVGVVDNLSLANGKVAFGSSYLKQMKYSTKANADSGVNADLPTSGFASSGTYPTRITSDPDTHEDFQPTNKNTGISILDIVQQDVKENPVMIYMKGLPDAPRCGFSALAVKVLQQYGVPIRARDILGDLKLKESVKAYTNWPTFPQVFIKGEFVGGSDIVLNMHQKGELKDMLADITHNGNQGREKSSKVHPLWSGVVGFGKRGAAMRFKKGNKVEVWSRREVPSGSWRSAEIISGNGHYYTVRYDGYPMDGSVAVDRVPRKAIRPCPPPAGTLKDSISGDVVEVFNNNSWKLAEVLVVVDKKYCSVRLLGSSREIRAHKSLIRRRLSWQDNKWVMIHKDSGIQNGAMLSSLSRGGKSSYYMPQSCVEIDNSAGKSLFPIENYDFPEKARRFLSRETNKRPFVIFIPAEKCNDVRRKTRATEKKGMDKRISTEHPIHCLEKVDAVASKGRVMDEKCMHTCLNNRTTVSSKIELGRGRQSSDKQKCLVRSAEPNDAESTSSSVGSCSVGSSPCRLPWHHETYPSKELYNHYDHAETSCGAERELSLSRKDELQAEIHQLELNAYRSSLIALHASGPVSWEREALMTNLRLMLNISNDEHLMELRNLMHSEMTTTTSYSIFSNVFDRAVKAYEGT
ncbi:agenet domain containing protein [Musa troglodytarum]|uniref:Agenet domain containing protein n=1 Tax=Musa troglodytarum TaxID=320322 RepID=A0A9E7GPR3_9LILI|nr:agenet domain containing protein [Musa troglodytarum]